MRQQHQYRQVSCRVVGDATVGEDSLSSCAEVVVSNEGHLVSGVRIAGNGLGAVSNQNQLGRLQLRSPDLAVRPYGGSIRMVEPVKVPSLAIQQHQTG